MLLSLVLGAIVTTTSLADSTDVRFVVEQEWDQVLDDEADDSQGGGALVGLRRLFKRVWADLAFDPLNPIGFLYIDPVENRAQCDRRCPVGFGCVVSSKNTSDGTCARCPPNTVSATNSSNCMSCSFDTLTWRKIIKHFLIPTESQSHCTMAWTKHVSLYNFLVLGGWWVIIAVFLCIGVYLTVLFFYQDSSLHRAMRFQEWERARALFKQVRTRGVVHTKALVTREGFDGKTPLQLVLSRPASRGGGPEADHTYNVSSLVLNSIPLLSGEQERDGDDEDEHISERVSFDIDLSRAMRSSTVVGEFDDAPERFGRGNGSVACSEATRSQCKLVRPRSVHLLNMCRGKTVAPTAHAERARKNLAGLDFGARSADEVKDVIGRTKSNLRRILVIGGCAATVI